MSKEKKNKKEDKKVAAKPAKRVRKRDIVKGELQKGKKKTEKLMNDFASFAMKGNVVDLAVGVVMGSAFGKIVTSLVNDIVMPLISTLTGTINLVDLKYTLVEATVDEAGNELTSAICLTYGQFLQTVVEFLIIAFSIFLALKYLGKIHKMIDDLKKKEKEAEKEKEEEKRATTDEILVEIRDILKNQK